MENKAFIDPRPGFLKIFAKFSGFIYATFTISASATMHSSRVIFNPVNCMVSLAEQHPIGSFYNSVNELSGEDLKIVKKQFVADYGAGKHTHNKWSVSARVQIEFDVIFKGLEDRNPKKKDDFTRMKSNFAIRCFNLYMRYPDPKDLPETLPIKKSTGRKPRVPPELFNAVKNDFFALAKSEQTVDNLYLIIMFHTDMFLPSHGYLYGMKQKLSKKRALESPAEMVEQETTDQLDCFLFCADMHWWGEHMLRGF